jgi:RNA polymerase sigma-70 factor, ECF subfamily
MTFFWLRQPVDATLARARAGDRDALRSLLLPHEAPLFRLCLAQLGNTSDAEDAAQETLLQAVRALTSGAFRGDAALGTYLVRIALRVCARRRARRRPTAPLDSAAHAATEGPEESVVQSALLRDALERLTDLQRAALLLQAGEGWSVREIAAALGVNEKKVENELYRARKALQRWEEENDV